MDYVKFVCFFPDGVHFASGSYDGAIRIWTLEDDTDDVIWHLRRDDGWVVGGDGELIMWIPLDLRSHLRLPNSPIILSSFNMKLHFASPET